MNGAGSFYDIYPRWGDSMRLFGTTCGAILATALVSVLTCVFSGCDSGASQSNGMKPIETNVLDKLRKANQSQGDLAKSKAMEKMAPKKK